MSLDSIASAQRADDSSVVPCVLREIRVALRKAGIPADELKEALRELRQQAQLKGWHKQEWEDCAIRCTWGGGVFEWECSGSLLLAARNKRKRK